MVGANSCWHTAVQLLPVAIILSLMTVVGVFLAKTLPFCQAELSATCLAMVTGLAIAHWRGIGNSYRTYQMLKHLVSTRCENFHDRGPLVAYLVFSLLFAVPCVSKSEMCTTKDEVQAKQWYLRILEEGVAVVVRASAPCWMMTSLPNPSLDVKGVDDYLSERHSGRQLTLSQVTLSGGGSRGSQKSASDWVYGTRLGAPQTGLLRLRVAMLLGNWSAPALLRQIDWLRKPISEGHRNAMYQDELQIVSPPPLPPPSPSPPL